MFVNLLQVECCVVVGYGAAFLVGEEKLDVVLFALADQFGDVKFGRVGVDGQGGVLVGLDLVVSVFPKIEFYHVLAEKVEGGKNHYCLIVLHTVHCVDCGWFQLYFNVEKSGY